MEMEQKSEIYPSNRGHKWTEAEESLLLEELNSGLSLDVIADFHNRTLKGISSRCGEIAYKMYLKDIPVEEIINQTKLDEDAIKQVIERKDYRKTKKSENKEKKGKSNEDNNVMENNGNPTEKEISKMKKEIGEIKNDIKDLKKTIADLVETLEISYKFD